MVGEKEALSLRRKGVYVAGGDFSGKAHSLNFPKGVNIIGLSYALKQKEFVPKNRVRNVLTMQFKENRVLLEKNLLALNEY